MKEHLAMSIRMADKCRLNKICIFRGPESRFSATRIGFVVDGFRQHQLSPAAHTRLAEVLIDQDRPAGVHFHAFERGGNNLNGCQDFAKARIWP